MQYFHNTHIDFVGIRKQLAVFSLTLTLVGLIATIILKPVLGIDFKGGTEIAVQISGDHSISDVRNVIAKSGIKGAEIKSFGDDSQFLIRVLDIENASDIVNSTLNSGFQGSKITMLKVDKIGPKVGSELLVDAVWAILIAVIAILIYIAFRFEFNFGLGAIVALVHDVIVTFSLIVIIHHLGILDLELNQSILAGMLTVIGYSINDTVIIFDRVRENKEKHKGMNFGKLVNLSLNETLPRTVNTVGTTILVLIVLFIFGGPVLQGFALTMFFGIVWGTYSSIYIASNFVIWRYEQIEKDGSNATAKSGKKLATAKA